MLLPSDKPQNKGLPFRSGIALVTSCETAKPKSQAYNFIFGGWKSAIPLE